MVNLWVQHLRTAMSKSLTVCGAETFTPCDPDIIELTAPYSTSNPTRGGQESCVVNGSQGRPYQVLFRRQWDLEKATGRQRLEPVILRVSLTACQGMV